MVRFGLVGAAAEARSATRSARRRKGKVTAKDAPTPIKRRKKFLSASAASRRGPAYYVTKHVTQTSKPRRSRLSKRSTKTVARKEMNTSWH